MHIGIVSPISIQKFLKYLNPESLQKASGLQGLKAPAVDALVHGFLTLGHSVSVYTLTYEVSEIIKLEGKDLTVFLAPIRKKGWKHALDLFDYEAKQIQKSIYLDSKIPDVLHAHWTYEYAKGVITFAKKIPVIVTIRDWAPAVLRLYPNYYRFARFLLDRKISKNKYLNFIANSPYIAFKVRNRWHKSIPIIPNPISDSFLYSNRKCYIDPKFIFVSISNNLSKAKNIKTLLKAYSLFRKEISDTTLVLIGNPFTASNPIIKKWKTANLLDGVELMGQQDHEKLILILDNASILVHPSLEESFGNILIEAMARNVPVIGGKSSGAVPYVLEHGGAGHLCDVTNAKELQKAMLKLYTDKNYREILSRNGLKCVRKNYSESVISFKTLSLYQFLLDKNSENPAYIK